MLERGECWVFVTTPEYEMGSSPRNPLWCHQMDPHPSIVADSPLPPSMDSRIDKPMLQFADKIVKVVDYSTQLQVFHEFGIFKLLNVLF
jgi:hypothetical protein